MITRHVGDTGKKTIKKIKIKNISPHSEHLAVLPLTPHTTPNRQTLQKEKIYNT